MNDLKRDPIRDETQIAAIREALLALDPESEFGRRLVELSLQGLDEGVEPMSADEISEYLGRERYEDVHYGSETVQTGI